MRKTEMREGREEAVVGTEGGRSPSGVPTTAALPPVSGRNGERKDEAEVLERPERRRFTTEYKTRILSEVEACTEGQMGALLRREGLYSSHLTAWRRQREEGVRVGLTPKRRGRKSKKDPLAEENARLLRENERLREKLRKAELIIDVQKKVAELLGVPIEDSPKLANSRVRQFHASEGEN